MALVLEGNSGFVIFFDNQHVQRFVNSFSVDVAVNGSPSQAVINMLYCPAFLKIEYLTDVKIFIKNIFSGKYQMVFEGQIHSRTMSISAESKSITFSATDYMYWLNKVPVPILFDASQSVDPLVTFQWLAKGINYAQVDQILTAGQTVVAGMDFATSIDVLFSKIDRAMNTQSGESSTDSNSIYQWVNMRSKIKVVSDYDAALRENDMIDIANQGAIIDNMYSFISGIARQLGHEFYQDIDGIIKIKEPYWEESILAPFVIDPILMTDFNESSNWDQKCTRVLVTGGVEHILKALPSTNQQLQQLTPAGVYVGGSNNEEGLFITTNQTFIPGATAKDAGFSQGAKNESKLASWGTRASIAKNALAVDIQESPYVWGGESVGGVDCSGFVYWVYNQAGFNVARLTSQGYYGIAKKIGPRDVQIGDLGFSHFDSTGPGHVGVYCGVAEGFHQWAHAANSKRGVVIDKILAVNGSEHASLWQSFGDLCGANSEGYTGEGTLSPPTGSVYKPLAELTDTEKKYGISLHETTQPLIRVGTSTTATYQEKAFSQLQGYTKYLYHAINAGSVSGSITLLASPWFRPGFNVWFDPLGMSRVYYVNVVRHSGGPDGVSTSLGVLYGRSEAEYAANYKGNLNPLNPLIARNNVTTSDYKGKSITPADMANFKTYVNKVHTACGNNGAVIAHNSPFKEWYGFDYIRSNTNFLNRWDSEFNLLELYCIINARYKNSEGKTVHNIDFYKKSPLVGGLNPLVGEDRSISSFARVAIEWDMANITTPRVIHDRAVNLINIITEAEKEVEIKYVKVPRR